MLLREAIEEYLLDCKAGGLSPKTLDSYEYNLERWCTRLEQEGIIELAEVQPQHMRRFLAELQGRNLSPWTVDQFYRYIMILFRWMLQ